MANLYYFKYTTINELDETKTIQFAGVIAANSWGEATEIIEAQETAKDGRCDLICIDQLECGENIAFTDDLELYAKLYKEMM